MQKSTDKSKTLRYTVMHYTLMSPPSFTFPFVNWQPAALVFWVVQQFSHIQLLPIGIAAMHEPLSLFCLLSSSLLLLQICQCIVTFFCIYSLDGFCVYISYVYFSCWCIALWTFIISSLGFWPSFIAAFRKKKKKKNIYIYACSLVFLVWALWHGLDDTTCVRSLGVAIWPYLHPSISTALMRPRRLKQYCLQLYICVYIYIYIYMFWHLIGSFKKHFCHFNFLQFTQTE